MRRTDGRRARAATAGTIRREIRGAATLGAAAAVAVAVMMVVPAAPASAAPRPASSYRVVDLGTLTFTGHGGERANAISPRGEIVGQAELYPSSCCSGYLHATVFGSGGTNRDLGALTGYTGLSDALAVNSRGDVVGWSYSAGGTQEAVIWPGGGAELVLFRGEATGINASGLVAGTMGTAAGDRAVTWDRGHLLELPVPAGATSTANGIDDRGDVIGSVTTAAGGQHAAMWSHQHLVDLGPGDALAVDNHREVVGTSGGDAVMWRGGRATVLVPDATANAISPSGEVAGTRYQGVSPFSIGFVWSHGVTADLPTNGPYNSATGVNAAGVVVGVQGYCGHATAWLPSK